MHYWIYQDSRILGPFAREDVLSVPGVGQGSLVCEGSATGAADQDWKPLDSVPELSGLLGSRAGASAVMPSEFDSFGQFQETAHALLDNIGRSDEYPSAVLQDPQFSALWGGLGGDPGGGIWDRHRVSDLETSVFDLKSQLEEQVKRQDEMLEKLSEKQKLIEEKEQLLAEREKEAELLRGRLRDAVVQPLGGTAPADGVSELRARIAQLESRQGSPAAPTDPITGLLARIAQLEARGAAPLPPADPVAELSSRLADLEARARGGAAQPRPAGRPAARAPASRPPPPPPAAFQEETPPWTSSPDLGELPPPAESAPRDGAPWGSAAAAPAFLEEAAAAPSVPDFKPVPLSEDLGLPPMRARTEDVPQFEAPPPLAEESGAAPSAEASWTPPPVEESPAPTAVAPVAAAPAPALDDGVPEATPLRSVSEMPPAMEFSPPSPETAEPWSPPPPAEAEATPAADTLQPPPVEDPGAWGAPPPMEAAFQSPEEAGPALQLQAPPSGEETSALSGTASPWPPPERVAEPMFAAPPEEAAPPPLPEPSAYPQEPPQTMLMGSTPTPVPGGDMLSLSPPQGGFPQQGLGTSSDGDLLQAFPGQAPTPMPIPLSDGTQGGWPSATPMPTMGQPDLPQSVMQGLGISSQATPMPGSLTMPGATPVPGFSTPRPITGNFDDILRGGATPMPGATPAPTAAAPEPTGLKQRLQSKKFLIGLGLSLLVLVLLLIFFLRNPKQVVQMVDMAPKQTKDDGFSVDNVPGFPPKGAAGGPSGPAGASPAGNNPFSKPPADPAAAPQQPAAAQTGASAAQRPPAQPQTSGRDFIQDQSIEAMEMVKNYQLDKSRGSIAKMLEYYFLGSDHSPEWSAGALEANVWVVEYHVFKGGPGVRAKKPTATYQFEVDLVKKTVIGRNESAQSLISGRAEQTTGRRRASIQQEVEEEMSSQKTPRRAAPARPRAQPRRPTAPEQAPLPNEDELETSDYTPPAGGGFNNPGDDNVGMESE
ncbi:MAG TPA: hypothetical protein DD417_13130 [Elusimicrobia bacterium]|nr:hypothetical protein [Elusimicrobiota bacterium]